MAPQVAEALVEYLAPEALVAWQEQGDRQVLLVSRVTVALEATVLIRQPLELLVATAVVEDQAVRPLQALQDKVAKVAKAEKVSRVVSAPS